MSKAYTRPIRRVNSSRFDKALFFCTKNCLSQTAGWVRGTPLLWLMTYAIYVNHVLYNNTYVNNKEYLHFSFDFHCSFHRYKYLNWLVWHGEMFLSLFLCLRCSVEWKVINNDRWIAWKNIWKTELFNCSNHQLIST